MKHTTHVKGFDGSNAELAEKIGDLYYDSLSDFLSALSEKIRADGDADLGRGRKKLAKELYACAEKLDAASTNIATAWDICSPHVDAWLKENGHSNRDK